MCNSSKPAPETGSPVTSQHCEPDGKLDRTDNSLEQLVPGGATSRQSPNELEDRRRHSQQAEQEGDHDQPEGPAPAAEDSCAEQRDEGGDRHQESHFRRAVITRQQLHRLIVGLGCQNENGNQGHPGKREEAEDQALRPVDHAAIFACMSVQWSSLIAVTSSAVGARGCSGASASATAWSGE